MHPGQGPGLSLHDLGETGGSETVTLLQSRDARAHPPAAGNRTSPTTRRRAPTLARPTIAERQCLQVARRTSLVAMAPAALPPAGGDQPHNNLQPYLTFYFNIALQGVFPPRT